ARAAGGPALAAPGRPGRPGVKQTALTRAHGSTLLRVSMARNSPEASAISAHADGRARRPGQFEQRLGPARAIVSRFQLIGAFEAARRATLDAAQLVEREPILRTATALRFHAISSLSGMPRLEQEPIQRGERP